MIRGALVVAIALTSTGCAHLRAYRHASVAELDAGRPLVGALRRAGWTATPEGSDRFEPGNIYDASHALQGAASRCFTATPLDSTYTDLEVSLALQAGTKVPLGLVSATTGGVRYKKLTYAEPRVRELAGMDLTLEDGCRAFLAGQARAGRDLADWYVVQSVLLAVVNEEECTELEAGADALVAGANASVKAQCTLGSTGQVAVAYKVRPVVELLGDGVAVPVELPVAAAALRAGACDAKARRVAEAGRDARLDQAEVAVLATAKTTWDTLAPAVAACDAARSAAACAPLKAFVAMTGGLDVAVDAGTATVDTACGPQDVALESASRAVTPPERAQAQAVLARAASSKSTRATTPSPPPFPTPPAAPEPPPAPADLADDLRAAVDLVATDPPAARARLEAALTAYPGDPRHDETRYRMAQAWLAEGDVPEAARAFEHVVQTWPDSPWAPWAILGQGDCFQALDQPANASVFYAQVVADHPDSAAATEARTRMTGP